MLTNAVSAKSPPGSVAPPTYFNPIDLPIAARVEPVGWGLPPVGLEVADVGVGLLPWTTR